MAGLGNSLSGMAGDAEVDDYMADVSLFVPEAELQQPIKPQVVSRAKPGQKVLWQKKREEKEKRAAETEESLRDKGLKMPIPNSNIGFKMLQKMGYTPGLSVGKLSDSGGPAALASGIPEPEFTSRSGSIASCGGRLEPVEVDLKRGRGGLGRDEVVREEKKKKVEKFMQVVAKKQAKHRELEVGYAERRRGKWEDKKLEKNVLKARSALRQLEEAEGRGEGGCGGGSCTGGGSGERTAGGVEVEKEGEEEEEVFTEEMLDGLLAQLRGHYFYCIHCGCKYKSRTDMEENCPGEDEDNH